jgi:hypothetical protein
VSSAGYSDDLREYYFSADPDIVEIETLELRHPGFLDENGNNVAVRIVNQQDDFTATLESDAQMNAGETVTFQACAITVKRPESSDTGRPAVEIAVANVSKLLIPYLDIAAEGKDPIYMTFRLYLSNDTSAPQSIIDYLTAQKVSAGVLEVTCTAGFEDILNKPFGKQVYTTREYPGLDR